MMYAPIPYVTWEPLSAEQARTIAEAGVAVVSTLAIADGFPSAEVAVPLLAVPALAAGSAPRGGWCSNARPAGGCHWACPTSPSRPATPGCCGTRACPCWGTDAPNPGVVHGASVHRELARLVDAGLTPAEALAAATANPAEVFRLTDRGRIRPGARAGVVLVDGRPDERITDSGNLVAVWKAGAATDLDAYIGSAAERDGIAALRVQTDKVIAAVRAMLPQFAEHGP